MRRSNLKPFANAVGRSRSPHSPDLRHRIERLEVLSRSLRMSVGRDVRHAIAALHTALALKDRRPPIAPIEELLVAQPKRTVDHALTITKQLASATGELERSEGSFHSGYFAPAGSARLSALPMA
jgi:hypothetical protein